MKYEFHVGDYVKTKCGHIGYVSKINQLSDEHNILYICYTDGKTFPCDVIDRDVGNGFDRIGQYDFTKPEVKQIEKLTYAESYINGYQVLTGRKLIDKINELVDIVNKLMKKSINE